MDNPTKPKTEPSQPPPTPDKPTAEITSIKPAHDHNRFFIIKHCLSLICSYTVTGFLITGTSIIINELFHLDEEVSPYMSYLGYIYTFLLAAILVFGISYLLLNWFERDRTINPSEKSQKVASVLTTIFSIGMFIIVLGSLVSLAYPLVGKVFGLIDSTGKEIAQQVISSAVAILVAGTISLYHIEAFAKFKKLIFTSVMGATILLVVILVAIFPAGKIRDLVTDQSTVDDLELIDSAISRYANERNSLPDNLLQLPSKDIKDVKKSLTNYTYKATSSGSTRNYSSYSRFEYELCATFKSDTLGDTLSYSSSYTSYSFRYHQKGYQCFTRTANAYSYPSYDY